MNKLEWQYNISQKEQRQYTSTQQMIPSTPSFKQQHLQHWVNKYCRVAHANKKRKQINEYLQNSIAQELFEDFFQQQKTGISQKQSVRYVVVAVIGDNFHHKLIKSQQNTIGFQYLCNSLLFNSYLFESQQTSAIDICKNEEDSLSQLTNKHMNISGKSNEQTLEKTFNSSKQKIEQIAQCSRTEQKQQNQDHINIQIDVEKQGQQLDQQIERENEVCQVNIENQITFQERYHVVEENQSFCSNRKIQKNLSIVEQYGEPKQNEGQTQEKQNKEQYGSEQNQKQQQWLKNNEQAKQKEQEKIQQQKEEQKQQRQVVASNEVDEESQQLQQRLNDEEQKQSNEQQKTIQKKDNKEGLQNDNQDYLVENNEQLACDQEQKYELYPQGSERVIYLIQGKQQSQSYRDDQRNQQQKQGQGLQNEEINIVGPIQEPISKGSEQGQKQQEEQQEEQQYQEQQEQRQEQQEQEQRQQQEHEQQQCQEQEQNQLQQQEEQRQVQEEQYEEEQSYKQEEEQEKQEESQKQIMKSQRKQIQQSMEQGVNKSQQMQRHGSQMQIKQIQQINSQLQLECIRAGQNNEKAQQIVQDQIETIQKYKQFEHIQNVSQAIERRNEYSYLVSEQIDENKIITINQKRKRSINQKDIKNKKYKLIFDKYRKMRQLFKNTNSLINLTHINTAYASQNTHKLQPIHIPLQFHNNITQHNEFRQLVFVWIDKDQLSNSSTYDSLKMRFQSKDVQFMAPLESISKQLINKMLNNQHTQFIVVYSNSTARSVYDCVLYPFFNCLQYFIYCMKLEIAYNNIRNECKGLKVQATNSPKQFTDMVSDYIEKRLVEFKKNRHVHALH